MAEIRPYKEKYFARRKKARSLLAAALFLAAVAALAAWVVLSRGGGPDPYAGRVVRISGSTADIGLVKSFREGKSISYYSAGSGFRDLVYHRFQGPYDIRVLARDAASYLKAKQRDIEAATAHRSNGAPDPDSLPPPPVEVVAGDEAAGDDAPAPGGGQASEDVSAAAAEADSPGYERTREQGIQAYDDEVGELAAKADRIDELWRKHRDFCQGSIAVTVGNVFGREWFGIYATINAADTPECRMMIQEMQGLAAEIDTGMEAAWDRAHRAGVYPGQIRAVQQKYRMELERWSK